jgi:hypothetical protein
MAAARLTGSVRHPSLWDGAADDVLRGLAADAHASPRLSDAAAFMPQAFVADMISAWSNPASSEGCAVESLGNLWLSMGPAEADLTPDRWILIAGLGKDRLPEPARIAADAVGATIAAVGHGLVAGGWPGVDELATRAFLGRLAMERRDPAQWLRLFVEPDRTVAIDQGAIVRMESVDEAIRRSVAEADAVVCISGAGGTARIARLAFESGVPVISFASTDGDAAKLYSEAYGAHDVWREPALSRLYRRLERPVDEAVFALPSILLELGIRPRRRPA